MSIWSSVEPGIGLIAISLAALRPLLAAILAGLSSHRGTAGKSSSKNYGSKHYSSKHYSKMNNIRSTPDSRAQPRPSFTTTWEEEEQVGMQLRGLPLPMGHFVSIEGGGGKQSPVKLKKSTSGSSAKSPKRSLSTRNSEEGAFGDKQCTIILTQDFKHYSGTDSDTLVSSCFSNSGNLGSLTLTVL